MLIVCEENKNCNKYICYYLRTLANNSIFNLFSNGIRERSCDIRWEKLGKILLPLPPLPEQQRIADYLDTQCARIDETMGLIRQSREKLCAYKLSLITEAVTKGLDKGLDPDVPMKDSGVPWIGEIPAEWELVKLKHITACNQNVLPENTDKSTVIKYIDISSVDKNSGIIATQTFTFEDAPSRARRIIHTEDIIISTVRTHLRAVAYIDKSYDNYICSTGFAIITPINKKSISKFIYYSMFSEFFVSMVEKLSTGISYPAITANQLQEIEVVSPPLDEQQRIAAYLDEKCARINALLAEKDELLDKLAEYKKSLIFECVTGKREVAA